MNLFKNAMSLISSVSKPQLITIIFNNSILNEENGIYENVATEYQAYAHIQQQETSLKDITTTAINSVNKYSLWLINLSPTIINSFASTAVQNTKIKINDNLLLEVISKEDYSYNGWIFVRGVQNGDLFNYH